MKHRLAEILNTSVENVDVFTILHSPHNPNTTQLDVRFSAHGSPYYQPEKINAAIDKHQAEVRNGILKNFGFYDYNIVKIMLKMYIIARKRFGCCFSNGQY